MKILKKIINTSENVNINVSLPVTTENINTNLESTAFDLNTFQESNNQIQVGATDANIDLGQYTTTTNEHIDIANYTDSTNYNVEEINAQYLQGENNYSEQLNIENINTFDMNQVNLPIETGNVDVGTNFEVGTNVKVGTNVESLPFIAPADDNIEQINQYTTATESTPIDINFGNFEQGATTTTNYEAFQTETTNDAQFDIQNLINTGLTNEEVGSTNIETQYIQEVEASDPSTEIQSLKAKVNELMGLKSQFDELEKLKAQLSEIENMQDHTEELNQLKAKVEELANAQKLKQEDNDTILLKKKIEELEEFKAKYEEEINALKGSEEKIETKIETSSKESNDIIKEETTQKYSVKGDIIHDPKELELITRKINKINQKITLNLIYKATIDSDRAEAFHEKCDQAQCSLVLVETDKGKRFGGFTTCSWKGDCVEKKDPDAFVFSLDKMETYENIEDEDAIGCYPKYGPVFLGCQIKINDNAFSKGGTTFEKGMNYNTQEDYELTGGDRVFGVKEVEVYDVIID